MALGERRSSGNQSLNASQDKDIFGQKSVLFRALGDNEPLPLDLGLGFLGLGEEADAAHLLLNLRSQQQGVITSGQGVNDFLALLMQGLGYGEIDDYSTLDAQAVKGINAKLAATLGAFRNGANIEENTAVFDWQSLLKSSGTDFSNLGALPNIKQITVFSSDGDFTIINDVVDADGNEVPVQLIEIGNLLGSIFSQLGGNYNQLDGLDGRDWAGAFKGIEQPSPPPICGIEGHTANDGLDHKRASCGVQEHYKCDGMTHSKAPCGHLWCRYGKSTLGECGVHAICSNAEHGDHGQAACEKNGHFACDGKDHVMHMIDDLPVCGGYLCEGNHGECELCHGLLCVGTHGAGVCDSAPCGIADHADGDGKTHTEAACNISGHFNCDGRNHTKHMAGIEDLCGGYLCSGDHGECTICSGLLCMNTHGAVLCGFQGHCIGDWRDHNQCSVCQSYRCDGEFHGICSYCSEAMCNGSNHSVCIICNRGLCSGDHGIDICSP